VGTGRKMAAGVTKGGKEKNLGTTCKRFFSNRSNQNPTMGKGLRVNNEVWGGREMGEGRVGGGLPPSKR